MDGARIEHWGKSCGFPRRTWTPDLGGIRAMTAPSPDIGRSAALGWQHLQAGNLAAADEAVRPWLTHEGNDPLVPLFSWTQNPPTQTARLRSF